MKRLLVLVAVLLAFAVSAIAQDTSTSSTSSQTSTTTSKTKKSKKTAGDEHAGMDMDHDKMSTGKSAKGSTLTGCVSASANSEGMYTLSNGRYKKGVEIGPTDKVKDHAGHQVALTGKWSTAAEAGEANANSTKEKGERHFEVDSVKHISETCSAAKGGGTTGSKKKGKSSAAAATPPSTR